MKITKFILIASVVMLVGFKADGQEVWTLEQCVRHALENNLSIKNALLNEQMALLNKNQAGHNRYPSLNANTNFGNNFGRTIDPATNQFRAQNLTFNSWSLNFNMPIFNGFAISNRIKQARAELEASQFDTKQTKDDIQLNVVTFYLNVLFAEDNLKNANNQLEISTRQLERMNAMIRAGAAPASERYDLEVQVALDEERLVQAENAVEQSLIELKNLLQLDPTKEIELDRPDLEIPDSDPLLAVDFQTLYNRALESQSIVKSSERQIEAARLGEKIASGGMLPSVSFGGSISTNYSNRAQRITDIEIVPQNLPVAVNGVPVVLTLPSEMPVLEDNPYFSQLDENFGYGVGITVSIPIYNNLSNRINHQRARLNTIQAENASEQIRQNLRTNVSEARANARAALQAYRAAERSLEASQIALNNAERKLETGTATTFDLINSQNLLNNSRNNLLQAKYDFIFKLKVIDYYLGNPLTLE